MMALHATMALAIYVLRENARFFKSFVVLKLSFFIFSRQSLSCSFLCLCGIFKYNLCVFHNSMLAVMTSSTRVPRKTDVVFAVEMEARVRRDMNLLINLMVTVRPKISYNFLYKFWPSIKMLGFQHRRVSLYVSFPRKLVSVVCFFFFFESIYHKHDPISTSVTIKHRIKGSTDFFVYPIIL